MNHGVVSSVPGFAVCVVLAAAAGCAPGPAGDGGGAGGVCERSVEGAATPAARRLHSHNDYERRRPLEEAIEAGVGSIEADVFLVDGRLLVAHDLDKTRPGRTLAGMYLDPLERRVRELGWVHPETPGFSLVLMVDIKADGVRVYEALKEELRPRAWMLSSWREGEGVTRGAVTVVLSGDRPVRDVAAERERWVFLDGRPGDLELPEGERPGPGLMPIISGPWRSMFTWLGMGEMPSRERERLRVYVSRARAMGYQVRFWGVPNMESVWGELWDAGVDWINMDAPGRAAAYLGARGAGGDGAEVRPSADGGR
ncbi:MAG: hypothetical protein HRU70_06835 [Phycisphaeraceae bacterium]|nr:MAG: hypothetical protein HRU70_06835 [Phycisphaeraceae bacterium]